MDLRMVLQCPGCQARFKIADDRVPETGAKAKCARCQQNVLYGRVDRGACHTIGLGLTVLNAGDDPDRGFVKMVGQVFDSQMLAMILVRIGAGWWRA